MIQSMQRKHSASIRWAASLSYRNKTCFKLRLLEHLITILLTKQIQHIFKQHRSHIIPNHDWTFDGVYIHLLLLHSYLWTKACEWYAFCQKGRKKKIIRRIIIVSGAPTVYQITLPVCIGSCKRRPFGSQIDWICCQFANVLLLISKLTQRQCYHGIYRQAGGHEIFHYQVGRFYCNKI